MVAVPASGELAVRVFPGAEGRLVHGARGREHIGAYLAAGGYADIESAERFLAAVQRSGLRGRGGAAFAMGAKLQAVRDRAGSPIVVANGEEGEPSSVKDRWLLRSRPHLVLDGVRLAAGVLGATEAVVYVSDVVGAESIRRALVELEGLAGWSLAVRIVLVTPTYVAGEETAAVQAIDGGPAVPTDKPPRPFESGVSGRPTLVSNVETLANLPVILRLGVAGYRRIGTSDSPGSFLMTLSGTPAEGLFEVPFGTTLGQILRWSGEDPAGVLGAMMGGYFSGLVGRHVLDVPLDHEALRGVGSALGCGAVAIMGPGVCPVDLAAAIMAYFARENARQCGSCFNGTTAMSEALEALRAHAADNARIERLRDWSASLRGRGACGTLDGAANVAASLLRDFALPVAGHLGGRCEICAGGNRVSDPPFAMGSLLSQRPDG